jgi:predicted RNA-binding Zn-ribbon protein involved in translation (DUF1610 family)
MKNDSKDTYCTACGKPLKAAEEERKCPSCGATNSEYVVYCGSCGKELPGTPRTMSRTEPPEVETKKTVSSSISTYCPRCGREITIYDYECPFCYTNLTRTEMDGELSSHGVSAGIHGASTGMIASGIVLILVGVYAIATGIVMMAGSSIAPAGYDISGYLFCCGMLEFFFGGTAALGGYFAAQEKKWPLAMAGAILGLFTVGPYFLGSIASLVCLILIAVAKPNFLE